MYRACLALALAFAFSVGSTATAQTPNEKQLLENPNDMKALAAYQNEVMVAAVRLAQSDADAAVKKLDEMDAFLGKLKVDDPAAKSRLLAMKNTTKGYRERFAVQNVALEDLEKKLLDNPGDTAAVNAYLSKAAMEISPLARSKPDEAERKLKAVKEVLAKVGEAAKTDAAKRQIVTASNAMLTSLERSIEAAKKLTAMIGKDAAPLKVEGWVNGSPLTDGDLKGKVVFLDFWAVWCGPCIATFPHLKEWNEKYADKGLVMIGLTNYYNFKWDEDAKKASRATEKITPAEEQEMLVKFAESHELKHRFAIEANRSLSEYYGVTGIPHVAIIDREGKIRMMKVGSGPANAKEIGDLLAELLETKAAGGQ